MARKYFGTDGIRGLANGEKLTPELALKVGMAAGLMFDRGEGRNRVVIASESPESRQARVGRETGDVSEQAAVVRSDRRRTRPPREVILLDDVDDVDEQLPSTEASADPTLA